MTATVYYDVSLRYRLLFRVQKAVKFSSGSHFFTITFLIYSLDVTLSVQAELGQMTATVYYDVNSVALDSKLLILQNTFTYRIQHESH